MKQRGWRSGSLGLAVCVALATAGPGVVAARAQQEAQAGVMVERVLEAAGERRTYWLRLPAGYERGRAWPLVLVLHPRGMTGWRFDRIVGMGEKADAAGFIAVYPNAEGNPRSWNAGPLAGQAERTEADLELFRVLLAELRSSVSVDPRRIYVAGHGNGAMMAYWLASALSAQIAAVGVVSGAAGVWTRDGGLQSVPPPQQPVPVIAFHGQHDKIVPYHGGRSPTLRRNVVAAPESMEIWSRYNGCRLEPTREATSERKTVYKHTWPGCRGGAEVVLYTLVEGNNKWPGGKNVRYRAAVPSRELRATDLMWEFFTRHSRP
jgi:polyhydroxybutyrate depolymerase